MDTVLDGVTFLLTRDDGRTAAPDGLYHRDTRYLSALAVGFDDVDVRPLHREVRSRSHHRRLYGRSASTVNSLAGAGSGRPADLVLAREQVVAEGTGLRERITVTNHGASQYTGTLRIGFDVDFADLFEVREIAPRRDRAVETHVGDRTVVYRYAYRDAGGQPVELTSAIGTDDRPTSLEARGATFSLALDPQESRSVHLGVRPGGDASLEVGPAAFASARRSVERSAGPGSVAGDQGETDGRLLDAAVRSMDDLRALTTETPHGPVPVAGVPWFATVFGRDALLTAYQLLPVTPALARGTLRYLAAHQGETVDADREEQPGKMLHEIRRGELARTGQIPHTPYYGSIDATPLWIVLLDETTRWVGTDRLADELRGAFERAVDWLESAVDAHGDDPFLYYTTRTGLPHKAWRDTPGSVQHADGERVGPPLATADVQGYAYDAFRRAAALEEAVDGDRDRAATLRARAEELREAFDGAFRAPETGFYATALAGDGEPVDAVSSNVGHCLWSGLLDEGVAGDVADRLLADDMFTGWGIRTMSERNAGYSPVSYHTGSVWPHENALIALGLADYGFTGAAETVADGLLDGWARLDGDSVPELFCGFDDAIPPVPYPAACSPQAWAAGAPFGLLRAVCDLRPGSEGEVRIGRVPDWIDEDAVARVLELGAPEAAPTD